MSADYPMTIQPTKPVFTEAKNMNSYTNSNILFSQLANPAKLSDTELFAIFPEAKSIVLALINELQAKRKALVTFIGECLVLIEAESNGDDFFVYFWSLWLELTKGKELQELDNKLSRLYRQRNVIENKPAPKGSLPDDVVQAARDYPIQDLFDVEFRRNGNRLTSLCPFHSERHGSFVIYMEQNTAHCFGACSRSFDSIGAYMELNDSDFKTTVNALAGVTV
jgi:hypothetical protein